MRIVALGVLIGVVGCASANDARLAIDASADDATDGFVTDGCTPTLETCNGMDDDCDTHSDEDFPMAGLECTVGMGACAATGHWICAPAGDAVTCDATTGLPGAEACDSVDNDCDGNVDEDFQVGMPCDGADADLCAEGVIACTSPTSAACTDTSADSAETCNGADEDCDGNTDEGFSVGAPCDGIDTDACNEGVIVCDGAGGTTCNDASGSTIEKCNGLDDDCRNGVDDTFVLGGTCTVGLGACQRTGTMMCNAAQTGTTCSATAGAVAAETCGNGSDEDCNGADAVCPTNDLPGGAIDISAGGTFTVDLSAAHDDNWAASQLPQLDCGDMGGRDVFYQFTLPAEEVVYFDAFGSNFDSVIRVFAGACTSLGATKACSDDACTQTRSQGAVDLTAGTYCLVLDQFNNAITTGAATLVFRRGGRAGTVIAAANGSASGTTTGKTDLSVASCEANSHQPDAAYAFLSCPGITYTVGANLCTGTAFDSVLYMRSGAATTADIACADDVSGCGNGLQSRFTGQTVTGASLQWLIVDGFGTTGNGAFTLTYTIQ